MKIKHKNSLDEFEVNYPQYTKLFGMYGHLVLLTSYEIYFIVSVEDGLNNLYNVTEDFEIIK